MFLKKPMNHICILYITRSKKKGGFDYPEKHRLGCIRFENTHLTGISKKDTTITTNKN
jgi:hypothetical protein